MIKRRHPNGDRDLRALERALAADPSDDQARQALARAQVRAGLRPPARKYLADLVLEMVQAGEVPGVTRLSSTAVSRKGYAVGIRAVLKKAKLSKFVTVSVPNYSMASHVEIQPTAAGSDPGDRGRIGAQVGAAVAEIFGVHGAGNPQYISLYVWAQGDRSDPQSDYFAPGGPLLLEDFWEEFKAGVRRSFAGKRSNNPRRHPNGDRDLRALERALAADPGDAYARAALIRARVRAGLLAEDRVVAAARLGDEASALATETPGEVAPLGRAPLEAALGALSRRECVRLAARWARGVLPIFEAERPGDYGPRLAVQAAEAFADAGSVDEPWAADAARGAQGSSWALHDEGRADLAAAQAAAQAAAWAASAVAGLSIDARRQAAGAAWSAWQASGGGFEPFAADVIAALLGDALPPVAQSRQNNPRRHPNYTQTDPHDPAALIDLALSYVEKPRPNVAKAREAMEAVYGGHPDLEEVAQSWAALARQGDPRAAIVLGWLAEFEIGFDLEPADADELFDRAIELGWPWATTSLLN